MAESVSLYRFKAARLIAVPFFPNSNWAQNCPKDMLSVEIYSKQARNQKLLSRRIIATALASEVVITFEGQESNQVLCFLLLLWCAHVFLAGSKVHLPCLQEPPKRTLNTRIHINIYSFCFILKFSVLPLHSQKWMAGLGTMLKQFTFILHK